MLIGGDDISNDVITHGTFKFAPVSTLRWLAEIWQLSDGEPQGDWRWNSNSRDIVASLLSFFFLPHHQSTLESLLVG